MSNQALKRVKTVRQPVPAAKTEGRMPQRSEAVAGKERPVAPPPVGTAQKPAKPVSI